MTDTSGLVDRWVPAWMLSRGMSGRRDGDGWLVEVAAETRSRELISATPSLTELHRLVAATTGPEVWLTLVGDLESPSLAAVAGLDRVTSDERMMTARLRPAPLPAVVRLEEDGPVAHARLEVDGELAARGQAAVRGGDAVFDRIETTPGFRRRGFGRLIMAGLGSWAVGTGATTGLLMASADGRRLYDDIGWAARAPIVTYRGLPD